MDAVALVSSEQQKFQKSIKGIKKLLKSGKIKPRTDKDAKKAGRSQKKRKEGVKKSKLKKKRGLVYISHIPHGFYENEMTQYFRQFGVVTNARVLRSARTGRSKGAAFVEFLQPSVAKIVAETMNNYLMGKRLLKAELIPPNKQRVAHKKNWNEFYNPTSENRRKAKKAYNTDGTDEDHVKQAQHLLKNLQKTKRKLKEVGIDYDFFKPVDVPPQLLPLLDDGDVRQDTKVKPEKIQLKKESKKVKEEKKDKKSAFKGQDYIEIESTKQEEEDIKEESESEEFDSDAFEKTLESDDDFLSDVEEESDEIDDDSDNEDSSDELEPPKKLQKKLPPPKKIEKKQKESKKTKQRAGSGNKQVQVNKKQNKIKKNKK